MRLCSLAEPVDEIDCRWIRMLTTAQRYEQWSDMSFLTDTFFFILDDPGR